MTINDIPSAWKKFVKWYKSPLASKEKSKTSTKAVRRLLDYIDLQDSTEKRSIDFHKHLVYLTLCAYYENRSTIHIQSVDGYHTDAIYMEVSVSAPVSNCIFVHYIRGQLIVSYSTERLYNTSTYEIGDERLKSSALINIIDKYITKLEE